MMAYNKNNSDRNNGTIEVEIVKHLGDIAVLQSGWVKELNIVSWNNAAPKFDIREWSPDHDKMSRGITLYEEEAKKLVELINKHYAKSTQVKVKIKNDATPGDEAPKDETVEAEEAV